MSQERLDALLFLLVEQRLLIGIDFNNVIDELKHLLLSNRRLYCKAVYLFLFM